MRWQLQPLLNPLYWTERSSLLNSLPQGHLRNGPNLFHFAFLYIQLLTPSKIPTSNIAKVSNIQDQWSGVFVLIHLLIISYFILILLVFIGSYLAIWSVLCAITWLHLRLDCSLGSVHTTVANYIYIYSSPFQRITHLFASSCII